MGSDGPHRYRPGKLRRLGFGFGVTNRVDTQTQVRLTYTLTGMADANTQDIGAYAARVIFGGLTASTYLSGFPFNITRAPDLTVFGQNPSGPFIVVAVSPGPTSVRWQANVNVDGTQNVAIDTTPAVIGTFDLLWNRPATGFYDAAIPVTGITGAYKVAPFLALDNFTNGTVSIVDRGVSSIVESVPEPGSGTLLGAGICLAGLSRWLRTRTRPAK